MKKNIVVILLFMLMVSCKKENIKSEANSGNASSINNGIFARTDCSNPYEDIGDIHNLAIGNILEGEPLYSNSLSHVLTLSKNELVNHTENNTIANSTINSYSSTNLSESIEFAHAILDNDEEVMDNYLSATEISLIQEVVDDIDANISVSSAADIIRNWECAIIDNSSLTTTTKDKLLVFGAVLRNSMEYWHNEHGGDANDYIAWLVGDAAGALFGWSLGGWWGALIGGVTASILVEFAGWDAWIE